MRTGTRVALLAVIAAMAASLMASSASATDAVQVVNEKTGTQCTTSGTNQCNLHLTGTWTLRIDLGIFGEAHELTCNLEVEGRLGGTFNGHIDSLEKTGGDANCPTVITECNLPWPMSGEEDGPVGVIQASINWCMDPFEGPVCSGNLPFAFVEGANEAITIQISSGPVGLCEFDADLAMESAVTGNAAIHVNHP